ncbi:hypothetical protein BBG47_16715 [Paenibacillus sp. KS1]|uniref:pyocin knob domain-containing protein n=1 Tax=Paenibacillus sp. KS1 TaxID=1849249 RepID=UPI000806597A|nr:pyocin knob domain-containing protein [Paenibacillus sp. KS1]OBY78425.1 hypothetical protein BBG47_16715 [Paenibacillus sp. KS1]
MAFEKDLPQWKEKGVKPPQSKLDEGWKVQDKPPAAWLNWQMNKTYEALKEVQEKAAEKTEVASAIENSKKYTDQKVSGIDLTKITPDSIGAVKKTEFDNLKRESISRKSDTYNDFNQYTEPGIYNIHQIGNIANKPNTFRGTQLDWGVLTVESTPQGYIIQTYTAVILNVTVRRTRTESKWSDWRTLLTEYTFQDPVYVAPNSDLNSITIPGDYMNPANAEVATMSNTPTPEAFSLSVYQHAGIHQVFRVFSPHSNKVWKRNYYYGVGWSQWLRVLDENDYSELKQSGVDAKNRIAGALNAKGVPASANDDFATLAAKISQIKTELSLVDSKISWSNTHSPSMYGDDKKVVYDYVVATMPNMKNAFVFDGSIWFDNGKTNSDVSGGNARAYLEDWNGKTCEINGIGHSTTWGYNYATNIFILNGRKGYKTVTSLWDGDKEAKHTSTSIQIPDGFDVSRPCLLKVKWEFYPISGRFYQVSIKCDVNGTITTC